jgi:hypothetical protein
LPRHDNDPERRLAALSSIGPVCDDLAEVSDPDFRANLRRIAAMQRDREATVTYLGSPTVPGGRFRVLRPHAQGGLGVVSAALDEELHREVALKEIKERYATESETRSRFLLEAEITGGLGHPGIVSRRSCRASHCFPICRRIGRRRRMTFAERAAFRRLAAA